MLGTAAAGVDQVGPVERDPRGRQGGRDPGEAVREVRHVAARHDLEAVRHEPPVEPGGALLGLRQQDVRRLLREVTGTGDGVPVGPERAEQHRAGAEGHVVDPRVG